MILLTVLIVMLVIASYQWGRTAAEIDYRYSDGGGRRRRRGCRR